MTKITDLFTLDALQENVDGGFIRAQTHPEFPQLTILNYTELAQYSRQWNEVTRTCRGLIYNTETLELLARPFPKIHNWDEPEAPNLDENAPLYAWSNKEDGSLGILYEDPEGMYRIATRGSFASEQALHASELVARGVVGFQPEAVEAGFTALFEIVYPENRIVLNYGELDDLILLGYVHNDTGAYIAARPSDIRTLHDLLMDLSRENKEGWVAWKNPYTPVKIKQADYVELHRIVTGLNRKSVWRALRDDTIEELLESVPDELFSWVEETRDEIQEVFDGLLRDATAWLEKCGGFDVSQRDFALAVKRDVPRVLQGFVFSLRSGKRGLDEAIWRTLEPKGNDRGSA